MKRRDFLKFLPFISVMPTVIIKKPKPIPLPKPPDDAKGLPNWNPITPCRPGDGQVSLNFKDMKEAYKTYTCSPKHPIAFDIPKQS